MPSLVIDRKILKNFLPPDAIITFETLLKDVGSNTDSITTAQVTANHAQEDADSAQADATSALSQLAALHAPGGAALVGNTPAGGISSTTVQAAINELDTEKAPLAAFAGLLATNGWQPLPGGLIFQWGQFTQTDTGSPVGFSFTLPVAFPTGPLQALLTMGSAISSSPINASVEGLGSPTAIGGFTIGPAGSRVYRIFAIGR